MSKRRTIVLIVSILLAVSPLFGKAADATQVTQIVFGANIKVQGSGATISGSDVHITTGGYYVISGNSSDGMLVIKTKDKVFVELNGVVITNQDGPAILVEDAKRVEITLKMGTESMLSGGAHEEYDAALYSNDTLVILGEGALKVNGVFKEGIKSDDDLIIENGVIHIEAVDDGISANDDVTINGGYIHILSGGDGIDSDGTVHMNGGTVIALCGTGSNNGGIDAKGEFTISGGTVLATGNHVSAPSVSSTQGSVYFQSTGKVSAGTSAALSSDSGNLVAFTSPVSFKGVFFSSGDVMKATVYTINIDATVSGTPKDGVYREFSFIASGVSKKMTSKAL